MVPSVVIRVEFYNLPHQPAWGVVSTKGHPTHALSLAHDILTSLFLPLRGRWHIVEIRSAKAGKMDSDWEVGVTAELKG